MQCFRVIYLKIITLFELSTLKQSVSQGFIRAFDQYRKAQNGIDSKALCKKLGISYSTFSQIRRNERSANDKIIRKLTDVFPEAGSIIISELASYFNVDIATAKSSTAKESQLKDKIIALMEENKQLREEIATFEKLAKQVKAIQEKELEQLKEEKKKWEEKAKK